MSIEVLTQENFQSFSVDIYISRKIEGERSIFRMGLNGQAYGWQPIEPMVASTEPTIRLPLDLGQYVLESLVRHYNGAEDTRALRKDYDDERKRVDRLTAAVIAIAGAPS